MGQRRASLPIYLATCRTMSGRRDECDSDIEFEQVGAGDVWATRAKGRADHLVRSYSLSPREAVLDPNALTDRFGRRFASYIQAVALLLV